jgi:hypothetical protein
MLRNRAGVVRLAMGRLVFLAVVAAVPMTIAFAAKPPKAGDPSDGKHQKGSGQPAVQRRAVNKLVKDFPEKTDLSTPESALAAYDRASARRDARAVLELSWRNLGPRGLQEMETVVLNQIFTFDPKGKFVSVKNVEGDADSIDHDRDSRQSSHTGAGELAGQMREAKAGNFWAKYRLWAAYRLGLNSPSFKNFRSEAGVALEPVQYTFTTRAQAVSAQPGNQREPALEHPAEDLKFAAAGCSNAGAR